MEGREKQHNDKCKEIMNDRNYDASCTLISLPVWDLRLIFVAHGAQTIKTQMLNEFR